MTDSFELPSLEEIEEMEKQQSQALESLQISNGFVKCQKSGVTMPILRTLTKPKSNRIAALQKQIKWIENYSRGFSKSSADEVKALKAELVDLLKEDAKADKLRSLPFFA